MSTARSRFSNASALRVLEHNQMEMERLIMNLTTTPTIVLHDEHGDPWTFTTRRRCRLFLVAKHPSMKNYEDVYATSK